MARIRLYFKGARFINNPTLHLHLDGEQLGENLGKAGFEVESEVQPGEHELYLKFGPRKQRFLFESEEGDDLDLELAYSRLWGNFKVKPRKR